VVEIDRHDRRPVVIHERRALLDHVYEPASIAAFGWNDDCGVFSE